MQLLQHAQSNTRKQVKPLKIDTGLYTNNQSVSRSKHSVSVIKTSHLIIYREIIAVCSQILTKHIKTQSAQRSKHTPFQL
jgi:hypothetical protein